MIPSDIEAEKALIACSLRGAQGNDFSAINACIEKHVSTEWFMTPKHQVVFSAILELTDTGDEFDEIVLWDFLRSKGQLEEVGQTFLSELGNGNYGGNYTRYIGMVRDKFLLRCAMKKCMVAIEDFGKPSVLDPETEIERLSVELGDLVPSEEIKGVTHVEPIVEKVATMIKHKLEHKTDLIGLPTGLIDLDRLIMGLKDTEMIILAARPSAGKSSLAGNIAEYVCSMKDPKHVLMFSLEMSSEAIVHRIACGRAKVDQSRLDCGMPPKGSESALTEAMDEIKQFPLWIDDTASLPIFQIRAKARKLDQEKGLDLVIVDYVQLVKPTEKGRSREQEISTVSAGLKALAKELKVPVLVLSQLNRDCEREKRQPRLADLRESGALEQDADVVIFIGINYKRKGDDDEEDEKYPMKPIYIAKNRNGTAGDIKTTWIPELCRFENYTPSAS